MKFRQVHLDFHTSEYIEEIGKNFSKENFQQMLIKGHIDSITLFSKCHHGWAYHPSKANVMHPHLDFDLLGAQIEAAHEIGVKTPVYLSAGNDERIAFGHREWVLRNADESIPWTKDFLSAGYHTLCMNTPYLDILCEQIKEVVKNYDADGIFLDIVGVKPCYCQKCMADIIERGKDPRDFDAVLEQAELTYKKYCEKTRAAIDEIKPGLPLFHNGGHITRGRRDLAYKNTHLELESLPTGGWGYDHFPMSARYVQGIGLEFLGMTGKFHTTWGEFGGYKHPNALRYETALSLANGAHCSIGDQLHPSGKMDEATYTLIGQAYSEVEAKETWCEKAINIADIGVLSYEAVNGHKIGEKTNVFDNGAVRMLLEGNYLFDVIDKEYDFNRYKVIILPDEIILNDALVSKIKKYIKDGGKILASGKSALDKDEKDFAIDFGIKYNGESKYNPTYINPCFELKNYAPASFVIYSSAKNIECMDAKILAYRENPYFNRDFLHFCSHQHAPNCIKNAGAAMTENNTGIYIGYNVFEEYSTKASLILKEIVFYALDRLLENKTIKTSLPAQGVITLQQQKEHNRYINHLLYASPVMRGDGICVIEDIVPIYDTDVQIKLDNKIKRVYLAPQMREIDFVQKDGKVSYKVDKIDCHQMVVLEY